MFKAPFPLFMTLLPQAHYVVTAVGHVSLVSGAGDL